MKKVLIFAKTEVAELLALALSYHGYEVIISEKPLEAFREIVTFRPQLVLAEYLDLDGEWLCRELRKLKSLQNTQIIMMSDKGTQLKEQDLAALLLSFGANGYLLKPFDHREFGNFVDGWMSAS